MDEEEEVIVSTMPSEAEVKVDLQKRMTFIGGSDAPAVLGLSPWKTRYELWQEKTGEKPEPDLSEVERVQMGILLEDVIAKRAMVKYGWTLHRVNQRIEAKGLSFPAAAQVDRRLVGRDAIVEIKSTGSGGQWGDEDTAEIPPYYYAQVQHQLMVTGKGHAYVVVLIGGNELRRYSIPRDEAFIRDMTSAEALFWQHVVDHAPPAPITIDEAALRWSRAPSQPVVGTRQHAALAAQYLEISDQIKDLEAQRDAVRLEVESAMQDIGDALVVDGKTVATWKGQSRVSLDSKALEADHPEIAEQYRKTSEYRTFRALKAALDFKSF